MELGPEDVSLLERCPHFRGCVCVCVCVCARAGVSECHACAVIIQYSPIEINIFIAPFNFQELHSHIHSSQNHPRNSSSSLKGCSVCVCVNPNLWPPSCVMCEWIWGIFICVLCVRVCWEMFC